MNSEMINIFIFYGLFLICCITYIHCAFKFIFNLYHYMACDGVLYKIKAIIYTIITIILTILTILIINYGIHNNYIEYNHSSIQFFYIPIFI